MSDPLSAAGWDDLDQQILGAVRSAVTTHDPLPDGLIERIQWQMTLAALRAEIAELETTGTAAVRGAPPALTDTLTFRGSTLSLMVTVRRRQDLTESPGIDLQCWVSRPGARVEVWSEGVVQVSSIADDQGRVDFPGLPDGRFRFVVHPADGAPVATPAVEL